MSRKRVRNAYMTYATDSNYTLGSIVLFRRLRDLRCNGDFVLLHSHRLRPDHWLALRMLGVETEKQAKVGFIQHAYYQDVLVKLNIFKETDYDKIIYMDSDGMPMKNMDDLFDLPYDISIPIAYWSDSNYVTTALMVVRPSKDYHKRLERHFPDAVEKNWFDMDMVNHEFQKEIHVLPAQYAVLNSEFEGNRGFTYFGSFLDAYQKAYYIHFTAIGKPWVHSVAEVDRLVQDSRVHTLMLDLWRLWYSYK